MPSAEHDFKVNTEAYYVLLRNGTTVGDFLEGFKRIISHVKKAGLIDQYRLAKKESGIDLKRLRDEVSPVARFVGAHAQPDDRICFALGDSYPDCIVCDRDGRKREIEVTVIRAKERLALMDTLNRTGEVRGIGNLPDDAALRAFTNYAERTSDPDAAEAYSTDQIGCLIIGAVGKCARRKARHQADILLIEVLPDMHTLAADRWRSLQKPLSRNAEVKRLSFSEVYVVGRGDDGDICLRIK